MKIVKHLLEVGVENWCETYERGNYYYCFWLKNGEQRYWTNMSEEHLEEIKGNIMENNLKKQDQQIDQLKQENETLFLQLSKQEIDEHKPVYCTLAGNDCKYLGKIKQLKQQLAEKEKENEKLKQQNIALENENSKLATELIVDKYQKAQKRVYFGIQLAIAELEKVKINLKDKITMMSNEEHCYQQKVVSWYNICNQINSQIEELKGEKNDNR